MLGESNYHQWAIQMKAYLMAKKLWLLVKGVVEKPSSSHTSYMDWLSNAYAAAGLILLTLEPSQQTHVEGMEEDPVLTWKTLEDIHVQKLPNARFAAYSNLLSISKHPEESLPALTTRIEQAMKDVKDWRDELIRAKANETNVVSVY